jgi:hypothetical protein
VDTTKGKFALGFWAILLFLFYYKIFTFAWNRWVYGNIIPDSIGILAIILIVIPVAFLSARLLVLKIQWKYHLIGIIGVVLLFSWNVYDDHRQKGLDGLFTFQTSNFKAMKFGFDGWSTDETEPVEELMEFLSQYRVKKLKDSEWDSNVSGEKGFDFMIHSKGKMTGAYILENRVQPYNRSSYYKILNGPVDMEWIDAFNEKYGHEE